MDLFPQMEHSYIESLHSAILSLKVGYRRAVLEKKTNLSNGEGNFGSTGPTSQRGPLKLVTNIPVGPNRNGPFHLMYQPKLPEFWVDWKAPLKVPIVSKQQERLLKGRTESGKMSV